MKRTHFQVMMDSFADELEKQAVSFGQLERLAVRGSEQLKPQRIYTLEKRLGTVSGPHPETPRREKTRRSSGGKNVTSLSKWRTVRRSRRL